MPYTSVHTSWLRTAKSTQMKVEGYDVEMDQSSMTPAAVLIKLNPDGTIEDALQSWITRFRLNAVWEDLRISAADIISEDREDNAK